MSSASQIARAFEENVLRIPLAAISPSKPLEGRVRRTAKFLRISASIAEIGLVEPLVVSRNADGHYRLLDGHARMAALQSAGIENAQCLVALDDEGFTYNKRIAHLATIQEYQMIRRAIERGASEARIAASLNVNISAIRRRRSMLDGICPEAIELLKSRTVSVGVFSALRRMRPMRQIEVAELMIGAGNFTASYARVLLTGSRQGDLVNPEKTRKAVGMTPEQIDRMQREMEAVQANFKAVEKTFGSDILELVVATGYVGRLIQNKHIRSYIEEKHPEYLEQFEVIVRTASLDQGL